MTAASDDKNESEKAAASTTTTTTPGNDSGVTTTFVIKKKTAPSMAITPYQVPTDPNSREGQVLWEAATKPPSNWKPLEVSV